MTMSDLPGTMFACECSLAVGEQLFATAPRTDIWLLLEYTGPWGHKALAESDLPDAVKARLQAWQDRTPNAKFQFIRQDREQKDTFTCFVALSNPLEPVLYRFTLDSHHDLLALDLDAIGNRDSRFDGHITSEIVYEVCTNGRRDVSCAKFGRPVYRELSALAGESAWQCTHIGGHRFAGTLAFLPHGLCYGRVGPDDVADLLSAFARREIVLDKLRGLSGYEPHIQAADYFLRQSTGTVALPGFRLIAVEESGKDIWIIRFEALLDGSCFDVSVEQRLSDWVSITNTGDADPRPMPQFHLLDVQRVVATS